MSNKAKVNVNGSFFGDISIKQSTKIKIGTLIVGISLAIILFLVFNPFNKSLEKSIIGDWYLNDGTYGLSFEKNGEFIWEEEDASGTYKILSNNTLRLAAETGEVEEFEWAENTDDATEYSDKWYLSGGIMIFDGQVHIHKK